MVVFRDKSSSFVEKYCLKLQDLLGMWILTYWNYLIIWNRVSRTVARKRLLNHLLLQKLYAIKLQYELLCSGKQQNFINGVLFMRHFEKAISTKFMKWPYKVLQRHLVEKPPLLNTLILSGQSSKLQHRLKHRYLSLPFIAATFSCIC